MKAVGDPARSATINVMQKLKIEDMPRAKRALPPAGLSLDSVTRSDALGIAKLDQAIRIGLAADPDLAMETVADTILESLDAHSYNVAKVRPGVVYCRQRSG